MKIILSLFMIGCFGLLTVGCGQSGPLYLPKNQNATTNRISNY